jgi:histone-lysine N-methyltransferase SETMAR
MCRTASLFLLQRLKGSISDNAHDFNNIETRSVIKIFFLQGKAPKKIHAILIETLVEYAPTCTTVKNWVAHVKRGDDFPTCDASRPGRHKTATIPDIINQIYQLILEDRRISAKSIAEQLGISRERVGCIVHEDLDMRKLSAKWVPKCLKAD